MMVMMMIDTPVLNNYMMMMMMMVIDTPVLDNCVMMIMMCGSVEEGSQRFAKQDLTSGYHQVEIIYQ